jgi:hypothetical protein
VFEREIAIIQGSALHDDEAIRANNMNAVKTAVDHCFFLCVNHPHDLQCLFFIER